MEIEKITLGGFKNIKKIEIELNKITSLLSINSYGKSNVLDAIIFGLNFIRAIGEQKREMMDIDSKPLNKNILYDNFLFELELINKNNDEYNKMIYGYTFAWETSHKKSKILQEYLKIKSTNSQKYVSFIKRDENDAMIKPSFSAKCTKNIKIEDDELIINKLLAYDNLFFENIINELNLINIYIDRHFNTSKFYDNYLMKKNTKNYVLNENSNIPLLLFNLKSDFPEKYNLIINTMKDIFPFISQIGIVEYELNKDKLVSFSNSKKFVEENMLYFLFAMEENVVEPILFSNMSDGVRRVLLILITLVLAEISHCSIVAIEEPENSLNPKILQRYLITLNGFAKNTKIIITSHSPYLVNYLSPSSIYLGLPNNDGLANFSKINEKSVNKIIYDARVSDMLLGDYLFSLMSGDESDLETLKKYME